MTSVRFIRRLRLDVRLLRRIARVTITTLLPLAATGSLVFRFRLFVHLAFSFGESVLVLCDGYSPLSILVT